MDIDKVRSLARGRIWSGEDAFQHGLVDGLGGLSDAITTAKELANLPQVSHLQAFFHALDIFPSTICLCISALPHEHIKYAVTGCRSSCAVGCFDS